MFKQSIVLGLLCFLGLCSIFNITWSDFVHLESFFQYQDILGRRFQAGRAKL